MQGFVPIPCIHDLISYLDQSLKLDNLSPIRKNMSEKVLRQTGRHYERHFFIRSQPRAATTYGVAGQPADGQQVPGVPKDRLVEHPIQSNSRSDNKPADNREVACRLTQYLNLFSLKVKTSLVQSDAIHWNAAAGVAMCREDALNCN